MSLGTSRQLQQCSPDKVDIYFSTYDGGGVNKFAKMAFLGLFVDEPFRGLLKRQLDNPSDIRALLSGTQNKSAVSPGAEEEDLHQTIAATELLYRAGIEAKARLGHVPVMFNSVNPLGGGSTQVETGNLLIRSNRRAMILASYEFTRRTLAEQKLQRAPLNLWNVSGDKIKILSGRTVDDILNQVDLVFPR